jgi:DNA-binding transcriptional LysR family regulator
MSDPVDLRLLRTLVEVQRAGSITAAAATLRLSQPAVTSQVKALEQRLGRPLFVRRARGVVATPLAEMLASEAAPHIDALQAIASGGLYDEDGVIGRTLGIGGPAELMTSRVVPALAPFVGRGMRVRVALGLPDDLLAALGDGRLDIVVSTVRVRRRGVHLAPLCDEELVLVGSSTHAESLSSAAQSDEEWRALLSEQPLIAYAETMPLLQRYWSLALAARPQGRPALVVPDLRGVLAAVAAGAGVSVLPRYLCADAIRRGQVRVLLEPPVPPINTMFLAVNAGRLSERHIAAVHAHLVEEGRAW